MIFQLGGQKCCQMRNIPLISFNFFIELLNLPFLKIFSVDFDNDSEDILKREKHFQETVFYADFKSAIEILI